MTALCPDKASKARNHFHFEESMSIFSRKKRSGAELDGEAKRLADEKATAQSNLDELTAVRREVELYGELRELVDHDAEIAKQHLLVERADARLEQIEHDRKTLAADAEQARRQAVYDAAVKQHGEGKEALRAYTRHAASAAESLARYASVRDAIRAANDNLPEGKPPISDPEPSNEVAAYMPRQSPAFSHTMHELPKPGIPHKSVLEKAILPTLKRGQYFYGEANVHQEYKR
jgi:hypothetical protein